MNAIANDRLDEVGGGFNPHAQPLPSPVIEPGGHLLDKGALIDVPIEILIPVDRF